MFPNFRIKIIHLIFFSFSVFIDAQDYSFQPEPIKTTTTLKKNGDYEGALKFNINALKQYEESGNTPGIIMVYTNIGSILCNFSKHKESLEYLDKAKEELNNTSEPFLKANLYNEYGRNYTRLGLYEQSIAAFNKAEYYIKKISNPEQKKISLAYNYSWKRINFIRVKNLDSLQNIDNKIIAVRPDIISYTRKADNFIAQKIHLDSAEYYMNKALSYSKEAFAAEKATAWFSYGDLYNVKGNKEKALEYYLKTLDIFQKTKSKPTLLTVYDTLSSVYKSLNDIENSNLYLRKYTILNDSINKNEKEAVNLAVNKLIELNHEEKGKDRRIFYFVVLIIVIAFGLLLYFIRKIYIKKALKKDKILEKKTIETDVLKLKVNNSFDEIIQLMESRSPLFLMRFKEVYPEFYEKLITHTPELTEHDIKFSAYIRLNLTNKEICQYENISLRGIETKRYRLKKKLKLSSNTDLQKWILEL
ncbi:tetratricopeptide (TPR) repeat protein [Chryseobacterium sediminis]|uniref:Tetratricopeptide (TPR) repeat protein n=1 Tax=Chryseobacterium sediminis TaxID=1679494 RepID=A0ABR6Q3Q7_9FLAO|nr:tetratricopeptide repeat protein [Chryseobacterium sediminis]MBB6331773.1 tetratricopeptide (TPR) repeat protein [Chryseobacterium sediminis]